MVRRGAVICVEGADKVGKSSLALKLSESLSKECFKVEYHKFPKRETLIGTLINGYLSGRNAFNDRAIHLLFSADRWDVSDQMEKQLQSGVTLILDRYAFSGVAYSAAKSTMSFEWCKAPDSGLVKPDLVLYLTASDSVISTRNGFGDEIYESLDFQSKVKAAYETLKDDTWKTIVSERNIDDTLVQVLPLVKETIEKVSSKPIEKLWI
ncbi:thymidylate kinase-like protein [Dinothrombium tinctorium]|uniref:Thymidylate kinase n=1 Tax=Dinothrombium tinctorium TaxID=1965070 RepID=A0A3S3PNZ0_9ACAR|nr:thymidylate kinase-like protein [Dinothrombium tinctorium]